MPSNFRAVESAFPNLSGMNSTEQKLRAIQDYLYLLLEQLRYTLENLGAENFNETSLQEITGPIYKTITDAEKGLQTSLAVTAEGISTRVSSAEGNITTLQQTANGLSTRVSSAEGNITTLSQTASGLSTRVSSAEGNITTLSQTASGLSASVSSLSSGLGHALIFDANGLKLYDGSNNSVTLSHGNLSLTGAITWADLSDGVQGTINGKLSSYTEQEAIAKALAAGTYGGTFINNKQIISPSITTGTLTGGSIRGATLETFPSDDYTNTSENTLKLSNGKILLNWNQMSVGSLSTSSSAEIKLSSMNDLTVGAHGGGATLYIEGDNICFRGGTFESGGARKTPVITGLEGNVYFSFS